MSSISRYTDFDTFCTLVQAIGFLPVNFRLMSGDELTFTVNTLAGDGIKWHSGDPEHDPWQWRIRVLQERDNIAYAKLFDRKTGYISRKWYPVFLSARRSGFSFNEAYVSGILSHTAKKVYELIEQYGALAVHDIRSLGNFPGKEKSKLERALIELQMRMFITVCGETQKVSAAGEPYGWAGTVFCKTEDFFSECFPLSTQLDPLDAYDTIRKHILKLSPEADEKSIKKLIYPI